MEKRTTLKDIARSLNLDKSTVSLALARSPKIADKTRDKVWKEAIRLGYRPNLAARNLSCGNPNTVCLVLSEEFQSIQSEVAAQSIRGLAGKAVEAGVLLQIISSGDLRRLLQKDSGYPVMPDGLLVWGDVPAEDVVELEGYGLPVVVLDPNHTSYGGWKGASVRVDNAGGAATLTGHLLERNVRRLLFVQVQREHLGHAERMEAARAFWFSHRSAKTFSSCFLDEITDLRIKEFTADANGAIFCSNDEGALHIWQRLLHAGLSLPRQVKLTGFDGILAANAIGLTTAVFDGSALARAGMEILFDKISNRPAKKRAKIPAQLRVGITT
jgi:DNA-binding LacI/PurR family transcriptional regulator